MGIVLNAATIAMGGLIGSLLKKHIKFQSNTVFAICIMLVSAVGVIENIFNIENHTLQSNHIIVVVLCLLLGSLIGDKLKMEERISHLSNFKSTSLNGFVDATMFFAIGGLQICGPVLLALQGDNSQLFLKSVIDLPFALMLGATYGKSVSLSAIPVAAVQLLIFFVARLSGAFIEDALINQLCSIGYIILFLTGLNMVCSPKNKIKNVNMLPAILLIVIYNVILGLVI